MDPLPNHKPLLRAWARAWRRRVSEEWVRTESERVCRRIMMLQQFADARIVGAYLAMAGEVNLDAAIAHGRRLGKRFCVPALCRETDQYAWAWFCPGNAVSHGRWNVPEPADPCWIEEATIVDLILVPGLVFDTAGGRLGQGGGHYDRLLRQVPARWRMGVAFEEQVVPQVPQDPWDVRMDGLVTNTRILITGANPGRGQSREQTLCPEALEGGTL